MILNILETTNNNIIFIHYSNIILYFNKKLVCKKYIYILFFLHCSGII